MYISKLTIHGFKSFANKETIQLGEGITTVVGPNGCGKTNIVDAIRWVLGEQKYSILRSAKMEDVIFNGAAGLKPLSMSEVTLTVHNNRGKLPLEYNDIEIGRRVYRSGESEYFMNRTPCRLKDIQDLFIDTGMGPDAYSVIELKMIEQILSETGDERKKMFEEAAGINKYKQQRRSAFRKFEATKADLENINNIIAEVESKVNALNLQLKRFKRHETLTIDLKENDILLATIQVRRIEGLAAPVLEKITKMKQTRETKNTEGNIHERELDQLRKTFQEISTEIEAMQETLRTFESERDQLQQKVLVWNEQVRSSEAASERLAHESTTNKSKQENLTKHISDYNTEIMAIEPRVEEKLSEYKEKREAFSAVEEKYKEAKQALNHIQSLSWDIQRKVADHQSLIARTSSMIEEKSKLIVQLETKISQYELSQKTLSDEQKELEETKAAIKTNQDKTNAEIKRIESILSKHQKERHDLTLNHHSTLTKVETLESQIQFYRELMATGEGYPSGIKHILTNKDKYPEVLGTVADLFQVGDDYRQAIETSLGEFAHMLVVSDRDAAQKVLQRAQVDKAGQITLIPLKEVSAANVKLNSVNQDCIERASALLTVSKDVQPLADFLLGNILVVKNLDRITVDNTFSYVDLDGAFLGSNYILKSKKDSSHGSVIGRSKKIETLDAKIVGMVKSAEEIKEKLDILETEIEALEGEMDALSTKAGSLIDEQSGVETEIIRNHYKQSQTLESIQEQTYQLGDVRKTLHQLKDSFDSLKPKLRDEEVKLENINKKQNDANEALISAQRARDDFQQETQDVRIELLNLENQRDNLVFQRQTAQETIKELVSRDEGIVQEIIGLKEQKNSLQSKITEGAKDSDLLNGKITKQRSLYDLKRETYNATYRDMEALENRIRSEQRSKEELLEELTQLEIQLAEYKQKKSLISERISDRYQARLPKSLPDGQLIDDQTVDDMEMKIQRIERSIENIGPINMAVQFEYEEEKTRLDLLIEQRDDLVQSEENLRETIGKIDRVARKQFRETYDQIKENFEKLFVLFFEGGTASLSLIGDPDPLDADVAIHAQPPGKRNQSLRMLSAGEKALTAIALLFSIYQVKPSPYCILDEVDAPLDDVNIRKFTRVLDTFARDTQFIVVTHNKLTMEAANYMYGVTMEQKGVSKLVSVKFDN